MEQTKDLTLARDDQNAVETQDDLPQYRELKLYMDRPKKRGITQFKLDWVEPLEQMVIGLVAQGLTLSAISDLPGMPTIYQVKQHARQNPKFKEALEVAYESRAEILADTTLQIADNSVWKTEKADRLKIDTARWLAQAYDKERYGSHTKVSTEHKAELTFLIKTGVPDAAPKIIEIERRDPSLVFKDEGK